MADHGMVSKSKRPSEPAGPDRLAMSRAEVERLLAERLEEGRSLFLQSQAASNDAQLDAILADLQAWTTITQIALDNLFIGSRTLATYRGAAPPRIGTVYDTKRARVSEALDRHSRRLATLEAIIAGLPYQQEAAPQLEPPARQPQPGWQARDMIVNVHGGNVNLGTVVGDVTSNVSGLSGPGADLVKQLMEQLAAAVVEAHLSDDTKYEAIEAVEVVSEGLKAGPTGRASAILRAAIHRLPALLQGADLALRVWSEAASQLGPYLPPGIL